MMLKPSPSSPSHPSARASLLNKMSLSSSGPTAPGSSPSLMAVTTPPGYKRAGTGLIGFLSDRVVGAIVGTERRWLPSEAIPRLALPRVEGAARQRCGRPSARVRFHPAGVIGRAVRPRLLRHEGNRRGSDVRTIAIAQLRALVASGSTYEVHITTCSRALSSWAAMRPLSVLALSSPQLQTLTGELRLRSRRPAYTQGPLPMIDKIRRDIQARLEELLGEIDRLRRALAALTSRGSEPASGDRAAPADAGSTSVGEAAAKSSRARTRRSTRTRSASSPPPASARKPASSAAAPTRTRAAPGATKAAVLAALKDASAMTAGEIAAATGLARATVSTTLSKLAASGEITKAARGYQIPQKTDAPVVDGAGETGTPTDPAVV